MQPIFSPVDHEARHSSSIRVDEDDRSTERTPLITARQVTASIAQSRNPITTIVVTSLLLILLIGVVIGVYLLIEEEDVMPPVENALQLVMRRQWSGANCSELGEPGPVITSPATTVVVVDTHTDTCGSAVDCETLLQLLQDQYDGLLPYNFLVSSKGVTYEGLGWQHSSPLFPEIANSPLVLAFIGNFTAYPPSALQVEAAKRLLGESVSQGQLAPAYKMIGKTTSTTPKYLFKSLENLHQWDSIN